MSSSKRVLQSGTPRLRQALQTAHPDGRASRKCIGLPLRVPQAGSIRRLTTLRFYMRTLQDFTALQYWGLRIGLYKLPLPCVKQAWKRVLGYHKADWDTFGAIIRIGSWGTLYYTDNIELPQNSMNNTLAPILHVPAGCLCELRFESFKALMGGLCQSW